MQVLYRSLLTLILSHAHGDALPARVGANLEAEILKVRAGSLPTCPLAYAFLSSLACSPVPATTRLAECSPNLWKALRCRHEDLCCGGVLKVCGELTAHRHLPACVQGLRWRLGPFLHSVPCCNGAAGCGCS